MTEERPRKYYHTTQPDQEEFEESQASNISKKPKEKTSESELYPILSDFLYKEYGIYSKRIDEKGSSNTKGKRANEWLHPDVVAIQDLTSGWHEKTKQCVEECSAKKAKLWSFEVKCKIDNSNVRKSFFQTVANSSWANYSYLVAEELDSKAASELRMLSALHGIGFIVLDKGSPPDRIYQFELRNLLILLKCLFPLL